MSSNTNAGSSHEGVLTSLLNEIDGVQELVGVTILAATNRPESIVKSYLQQEKDVHSRSLVRTQL